MHRFASAAALTSPVAGVRREAALVAFAAALAMLAFLLWPRAAVQFPYTPDSADYIEQARSLLRGENARVLSDSMPGSRTEPSRLFPIGFPIALAALGSLGLEPRLGAVLLNGAAGVLLPLLLFYLFAPVLRGTSLALVIALAVFSPGLWNNARVGLSDTFALLFCVGAIGLVARRGDRTAFAWAGILAGIAYSIRNANLALIAAFYAYFVLAVLGRGQPRRTVLGYAACFTLGLCAIVLPVALRNVVTFGLINPYEMAPSTIGLLDNARMFVAAILEDLTASYALAKYLAWWPAGQWALAGMVAAGAVWTTQRLPSLSLAGRRAALLSLLFAAFGAIVVVVARSRYEWGDQIGPRYTFPYVPFIAIAAAALFEGAPKSRLTHSLGARLLAAAAVILVFSKLLDFASAFGSEVSAPPKPSAMALEHGREAFCQAPGNALLVSNFGFVFRIDCEAPVQGTPFLNRPLHLAPFLQQLADQPGAGPLIVGLFPGFRGVEAGDLPVDQSQVAGLEADLGFAVLRNDREALIGARNPR